MLYNYIQPRKQTVAFAKARMQGYLCDVYYALAKKIEKVKEPLNIRRLVAFVCVCVSVRVIVPACVRMMKKQ